MSEEPVVKQILLDALALPESQRAEFLQRTCTGDAPGLSRMSRYQPFGW